MASLKKSHMGKFMYCTKYYYDKFVSKRAMKKYRGSRFRAPLILNVAVRQS
jgi:hypothetical protein